MASRKHKTAWTSSSSLTSDRIPARQSSPAPSAKQQSSKGKAKAPTGPPKSKVVAALEALLHNAQYASGLEKDAKGGCFCQAREHDLSPYVPLCYGCGLVLCKLNPPYCACPHCGEALLDSSHRAVLVAQLEEELQGQIAKEEEERQRAIEEARKAEGAFPLLPNAGPQTKSTKASATPPPQSHKVMSLNSTTKRVTVSSYTSTPVPSRPPSPKDVPEEPHRVPPPPKHVPCIAEPPDPAEPWINMEFPDLRYIPLPKEEGQEHTGSRRAKKGGRKGMPSPSGSSQPARH
ncbi:hypothetical protein ID866_9293 [Astraeus odoratus]|nr:hypothetical protein ID866_9293 [Astraeus odoratus]